MRDTIVGHFVERAQHGGGRPALRELVAGGAPVERSLCWRDWERAARAFAAALVRHDVPVGSRVAILAANTLVWPIADLGTLMAGCVSAGVYPTASSAQLQTLITDCGAEVLVIDGMSAWRTLCAMESVPTSLRYVIAHDLESPIAPPLQGSAATIAWDVWLARGLGALDESVHAEQLQRRLTGIRPSDVATLIYTSGSTGQPKGARLSHRCLIASAASVRATLALGESDSSLSFLPFAHAAERIFGLYTRVFVGMCAGLVRDPARVFDAARAFSPTLLGGVPRLFEKLYEGLLAAEARENGDGGAGGRGTGWSRALQLGVVRSRLRRARQPVPSALERDWQEAMRPVRRWLAGWVGEGGGAGGGGGGGDGLRLTTSGGATLPPVIAETLDAIGITVLGAYGLTEHLCVAFNRPDAYTFDGVGTPMPGTELRIAADGEVQVRRSSLTFSGYHGMSEASAEAFSEDGAWLLTGDLGALDERGVLRITGRKKELIALSGGKKIAPLPIEARLVEDPWIAQAMCYGEGRKFLSALLCLRAPVVTEWARTQGISCPAAELTAHPAVLTRIQQLLDRVNAQVASPEQIKRFHLLDRELSSEHGELTDTMKVRRPVVTDRFHIQLEALYQ